MKYIALRIVVALIFILLANAVYWKIFFADDVRKHADSLENLWVVDSDAQAIYFGESSNFHITDEDTFKHRISYILNDLLPEYKLATVDNAGLHAGTYLALLKHIPQEMPIEFVVVTMNYRSFGASWRYAQGENYLAKTERLLDRPVSLLSKFRISLKDYDQQSDQAREQQMLDAWRTETFEIPNFKHNTIAQWDSALAKMHETTAKSDFTPDELSMAFHYIKNFAFDIDFENNERIRDFDQIVAFSKERGFLVFFNLLDENMEELNRLVGPELSGLIEKNRALLVDRYTEMGAVVIDNFNTVPDSCFVDRKYTTEHYSYEGKGIIARHLAEAIRQTLKSDSL